MESIDIRWRVSDSRNYSYKTQKRIQKKYMSEIQEGFCLHFKLSFRSIIRFEYRIYLARLSAAALFKFFTFDARLFEGGALEWNCVFIS